MPKALALLLVAPGSVVLAGCCALLPCHPATALVGAVAASNGAPIAKSRVVLYGINVRTNAKGCFKARLRDALPFTFVVAAEGYKTIEMKAKPGFYRAKVSLAPLQSSEASRAEWLAISSGEYEVSSCP